MASKKIYMCDWCEAVADAPIDDDSLLPETWHYIPESHEEICFDCHVERNKALTAAMSKRSGKPDPNARPAPLPIAVIISEPQPDPDSALVTDEAAVIE